MDREPVAEESPADESDLARFGYKQSLGRTLGGFSSFAAGFAYISILTGLFQMMPLGYRSAGPAFFWTWPVVAAGQFCVALCFAELSTHYPLCGSLYQWSRRMGGDAVGWMAGWVSLAGSIVALAAVSMALQASLPVVWSRFQFVGSVSNASDSAKNAVIIGAFLIALTTLLNARGVALLAKFNNLGVIAELTGAVLLVGLLFRVARHSPVVVMTQAGASNSEAGWVGGAFLAAALTASYVLYGFDTAGSLAEETVSPRKNSPRAILLAISSAAIVGGLLIVSALMAARNPNDVALGRPDGGLAKITTQALGPGVGRAFLVIVAVAIASCALTVQTGAVRLIYAMARDGRLPGSKFLARVGEESRTPTIPAVVVGIFAAAILLFNINHAKVVEAVGSVSVVWINLSYLLVTVPMLFRRLRGWPGAPEPGLFHLGRLGLPINFLAVIWGFAIVVNTAWPRAGVYGEEWPIRFIAPIGTFGLLAAGFVYYNAARNRPETIAAEPRH